MSAEEALAYGLIDEIVQPNDEKIRQLSLPPPSQSPELFSEIPKTAIDYEFGKLVGIQYYSWLRVSHQIERTFSFNIYLSEDLLSRNDID